jgi:DNA-damage-inducible protein D
LQAKNNKYLKSVHVEFTEKKLQYPLFNHSTQQMKDKWDVVKSKPLADFMPTILLKAKDFATEITIYNAKDKLMQTETAISNEHITNNETVRNTLISRGITPENLSPEEEVKKIERKLTKEKNQALRGNDGFKRDENER